MDCAVIPLRHGLSLIQTIDFFYPLVDDPFIMGKIALANVLSDIYAVGVTEIDKIDMLISAPIQFSDQERNVIISKIMEGFFESAKSAGCKVLIKNIFVNPWCIIGGVATSVINNQKYIMPSNAKHGDFLVLTKPLGTHLATNVYLWMQGNNEKFQKLANEYSRDHIKEVLDIAINSMTYLNKNAALLMGKYNAHAATDVTGFGLLGHAKNLALFQRDTLAFRINKLPIIKSVLSFGRILNLDTKLRKATAVETSGGLLICFSPSDASEFCKEFKSITKGEQQAWIIGHVEKSDEPDATLSDDPEIFEVDIS